MGEGEGGGAGVGLEDALALAPALGVGVGVGLTLGVGHTSLRSLWPLESAITATPLDSMVMLAGALNVAAVPGPSAPPAAPVPATVLTTSVLSARERTRLV